MGMQQQIEATLQAAFRPDYLEVVNESANHNVPAGSESHFKVTMVAEGFTGERLIGRHRAVNATLKETLGQIHALALHTYTPAEWAERQGAAPASPPCMGGGKG